MIWLRAMAVPILVPGVFAVLLPLAASRNDRRMWPVEIVGTSLGWLFIAVGGALVAWALVELGLRGLERSADRPPQPRLVMSGPYARLRNPIYLGSFVVLLGEWVLTASGTLGTYAFTFLIAVYLLVLLHEEPMLTREYGRAYRRYLLEVRRWMPQFDRVEEEPDLVEAAPPEFGGSSSEAAADRPRTPEGP